MGGANEPQPIEPVVASPKGALMQRYALVEWTPAVGDMAEIDQT